MRSSLVSMVTLVTLSPSAVTLESPIASFRSTTVLYLYVASAWAAASASVSSACSSSAAPSLAAVSPWDASPSVVVSPLVVPSVAESCEPSVLVEPLPPSVTPASAPGVVTASSDAAWSASSKAVATASCTERAVLPAACAAETDASMTASSSCANTSVEGASAWKIMIAVRHAVVMRFAVLIWSYLVLSHAPRGVSKSMLSACSFRLNTKRQCLSIWSASNRPSGKR